MIHYTASHINNNWQTLDLMICYFFPQALVLGVRERVSIFNGILNFLYEITLNGIVLYISQSPTSQR